MNKTTQALSVEIIRRIARMLNSEIEQSGEIKINNKRIWDGYLHQMPNEAWRGVLETLELLAQQHPRLVTFHQLTAIKEGLDLLDRYDGYYDGVLDVKTRHLNHKRVGWRCLMTVREVYNQCCDIYLPNTDQSRVTTTFGEIFEDTNSITRG